MCKWLLGELFQHLIPGHATATGCDFLQFLFVIHHDFNRYYRQRMMRLKKVWAFEKVQLAITVRHMNKPFLLMFHFIETCYTFIL
jgi:hypothetical protein